MTAEDFRFWWEDMMQYEDLGSVVGLPSMEGEVEVVDDFTFTFIFPEPRGTFLFDTATSPWGYIPLEKFPAHYLKQFHPEYVSASDLEAEVRAHNFDTWDTLFDDRRTWESNPDIPQTCMWVLDAEPDPAGFSSWVRNPYYYKVDVEGNQLPYIDYINGLAYDKDTAVMKQMQGEIDYGYRQWRVVHYPSLKQGEFRGHYTTGSEVNPKATQLTLMMNQCTEDEVLRELFQDIRFREAVSHAIDRDEIVDVVWNGLGEPTGLTVGEYVGFWRPEWKGMYSEYDPALANQILDEIGLEWDANQEYRLRPDGQTLEIIYSQIGFFGGNADAHQLFVEDVEAVGIKVIWKQQTGEAHEEWARSNESQWVDDSWYVDEGNGGAFTPGGRGNWGNLWTTWLESDGEEGVEPPEPMKEIYEWKLKGDAAATMEERNVAYGEAMDLMVKNLYVIGIAGHDVRPSTIHERLRNCPQNMYFVGVNPMVAVYPANFTAPETWYLDQDWRA
jgi:peptide/nickel transport system substrate-binding protein